uniref:non-specific serine/threonine protein kinase n=1 Tax=Tetraselmis sp. GSL018 TaxID=582737 RepID=A0A061QR26_9CHLO
MEKYVKGKLLGKGSFGKATVVERRSDGAKFVLKEIDISRMPKQEKEASLQEAQLLKALKHPNIVSCQETFLERGILCIIMDYCSEGDLYQALQRRKGALLREEQILDWAVQLFLGLKHVHDRKILHRDLKSQNVFISKGGILKLGDFGVSKVLNNTHHLASTAVGTPYYLSPEICQSKKYNQKSDIWSLGCLLYEMTSLKHAFEAGSLKLLIHKIITELSLQPGSAQPHRPDDHQGPEQEANHQPGPAGAHHQEKNPSPSERHAPCRRVQPHDDTRQAKARAAGGQLGPAAAPGLAPCRLPG